MFISRIQERFREKKSSYRGPQSFRKHFLKISQNFTKMDEIQEILEIQGVIFNR